MLGRGIKWGKGLEREGPGAVLLREVKISAEVTFEPRPDRKEQARQIPGGRVLPAEGTAWTEALRQKQGGPPERRGRSGEMGRQWEDTRQKVLGPIL